MLRAPVNRLHKRRQALGLLTMGLMLLAGCKATVDDIETWKGTMKGPRKIVAVLKSPNYDLNLRSRAALALVEMAPRTHPKPLDPLAYLQNAVQRLDGETRTKIIEEIVPGLEKLMVGKDTTPEQVRAKDAAFLLIPHASPALRTRLTNAVMDWYVADFNGRNLSGNYSAQQVIEVLGAPAAEKLVTAINREMPPAALVKLTEMIGQLGSAASKKRAGERLVVLEKEMEGSDFLDWLKEKIRASIREQWGERVAGPGAEFTIRDGKLVAKTVPETSPAGKGGLKADDVVLSVDGRTAEDPSAAAELLYGPNGSSLELRVQRGATAKGLRITRAPRPIPEGRVTDAAKTTQEERILDGALPAMKNLNSVAPVAERLLAIAEQKPAGDDAALTARRTRSLNALEGGAREKDLSRLLDLALSNEVPLGVRDVAFDRVGDIRNKAAIPRIWPLFENDSYENGGQRLRWRAGEMILYIGGADIVREFMQRLPRGAGRYEPEELEGYAQRMSQMSPPPTSLLRSQLRSGDWWKQVIALRYFQRKGEESDVARLSALKRSRTAVAGDAWSRLTLQTVGDVATDAIQRLQERLSGGATEEEAGEES